MCWAARRWVSQKRRAQGAPFALHPTKTARQLGQRRSERRQLERRGLVPVLRNTPADGHGRPGDTKLSECADRQVVERPRLPVWSQGGIAHIVPDFRPLALTGLFEIWPSVAGRDETAR